MLVSSAVASSSAGSTAPALSARFASDWTLTLSHSCSSPRNSGDWFTNSIPARPWPSDHATLASVTMHLRPPYGSNQAQRACTLKSAGCSGAPDPDYLHSVSTPPGLQLSIQRRASGFCAERVGARGLTKASPPTFHALSPRVYNDGARNTAAAKSKKFSRAMSWHIWWVRVGDNLLVPSPGVAPTNSSSLRAIPSPQLSRPPN